MRARRSRAPERLPVPRSRRGRPLPRQSQVFFFLILGFMLFMTWLVFEEFVIYMVTGCFVAVLALPMDKAWERIMPNRLAAFATMLSVVVMIAVPLLLLGIFMYQDVTDLADRVQSGNLEAEVVEAANRPVPEKILEWIYPEQNATDRNATVVAKVDEFQGWAQGQLDAFGNELLRAVPDFFIGVTIVMFVVYYVLVDGDRLVAYLRRTVPLPGRQVDFLMREARNGLTAVFNGQILTSLFQGILGGIGFWITGLPNPVLWGALMAILALLPVVGAFMIWIPGVIVLVIQGEVLSAIFLALWGLLVVGIFMDNVVRPRLIGTRADIHPMFVLVGVLGGAAVFGFIGLFLGPLLVGITIAVLKVYEADYLDPEVNLVDEADTHELTPAEPADPDTAPAVEPK